MSKPAPDTPESDVYEGAPHPRHAYGLVGHRAAEADMLAAYREGRLAHAWLIGGKEGVGKATLAWRFARFLLANPDPAARAVQEAQDLSVPPGHPTSRQLAAMAHPDFSLMRREWNPKSKGFYSELRVDDIRQGLRTFSTSYYLSPGRLNEVEVNAYHESGAGRDRLTLTRERVAGMASALREIAERRIDQTMIDQIDAAERERAEREALEWAAAEVDDDLSKGGDD